MTDSVNLIANDLDALSSRWSSDRSYMGSPVDDVREIVERLRALSARASAGEGGEWVMVPRKMTTAMWKAWEQSNQVSGSYQEDYDAMLAAAPQPAQAGDSGGVRIKTKGPDDFASHVCPAESSAVWNAFVYEHDRIAEGLPPILSGTEVTPASPATGDWAQSNLHHAQGAADYIEECAAILGGEREYALRHAAAILRASQPAAPQPQERDLRGMVRTEITREDFGPAGEPGDTNYQRWLDQARACSTPPAHGDGEVLGFLRKFDADFIARKQHGQCQVIIYQERPRKDAVPLYTAPRPTPEAQEAARVTVTKQGVSFGPNCWFSHEQITGRTAECLNSGKGGVIANQYMAWVDAALALPAQGEGS